MSLVPVVVERDRDGVNSSVGLSRLDATDVGRVSLSCQCHVPRASSTGGLIYTTGVMSETNVRETNEWQINILTNDIPSDAASIAL